MSIKRVDACKLDQVIKKYYGREWGIPSYMEGQRKIEVSVSESDDEQKLLVQAFIDDKIPKFEIHNTFEAILCDLCSKGIMKESDYLICFDD